jgi:DNA-binding NarL/FixJ family response regulator
MSKVFIFDGLTGQSIEREATKEELAIHKAIADETASALAEQQAKVVARQSALAKLAALGLTEAEIASL